MKIGVVEANLCPLFGLTSKSGNGGRTLHNVASVTYFKRYRKSEDNVPSRFFHSTRGTEKSQDWVKNLGDYPFESGNYAFYAGFKLGAPWIPSPYRPVDTVRGYRPDAALSAAALYSCSCIGVSERTMREGQNEN